VFGSVSLIGSSSFLQKSVFESAETHFSISSALTVNFNCFAQSSILIGTILISLSYEAASISSSFKRIKISHSSQKCETLESVKTYFFHHSYKSNG
jgi:hypothetical protein